MFDNKLLINLYVLSLSRNFEIFIPIDEKVGNVIRLIENSLSEYSFNKHDSVLLSLLSGQVYNNNDVVRNTDIKNGVRLILI